MWANRIRLLGVATLLSTIAIAAPAATAGAATVTGQTFVASPAATFINYHSQTSAGEVSSGSQVAP